MPAPEAITPVLLDKVYKLIDTKIEKSKRSMVEQLAKRLVKTISDDDIQKKDESNLFGAVLSLWHHLNHISQDETLVRVFNPSLGTEGWQSTHTIVEIVTPDLPFLVDSIRIALSRLGITTHFMLHGPHQVLKNNKGEITAINDEKAKKGIKQSLFHIEIDRMCDKEPMQDLEKALKETLHDLNFIVADWKPMKNRLQDIVSGLKKQKVRVDKDDLLETVEFLEWLANDNFTFMSYKYYALEAIEGDHILKPSSEEGFGLAKKLDPKSEGLKLSTMAGSAISEAWKNNLLIINKAGHKSRVHRPAYLDYIGIKVFDAKGNVKGEHRFHGLYASSAYNQETANIPVLGNKVKRILEKSGFEPGSHSWRMLANIVENFPRDELFQATEDEMLEVGMGVVQIQDRDKLKVFVRRDPFARFFSCMVYVTRERYNTEFRRMSQDILKRFFGSQTDVEFTTFFSESPLARTHYIVRVKNNNFDIDLNKLEQNLTEAATSWDDQLHKAIIANFGEYAGTSIAKRYKHAFPRSYKEVTLAGYSVADIEHLELLSDENKLSMLFYRPQEELTDSKLVRLKLFQKGEPIHLSDVMPILENLGLRVLGEAPYKVKTDNGETYWILDFSMWHNVGDDFDLEEARERFQTAFADIWYGNLENDGFNRLVLNAGLSGKEVTILRAYARYMRQVTFPFSQNYIEDTLNCHTELATLLVKLFKTRFAIRKFNQKAQTDLVTLIERKLEKVESLDDDRIIRRYMEMMLGTLRTNYFQLTKEGKDKNYLSFKVDPNQIPEIPKPVPAYEIFVYSPDVEGLHLRGGKIARGGLRWSDRPEDFRTEILGLVKAQQVKNTVIVPVGAKGGFVCKRQFTTRDEIFAEGQRCYRIFICALLDLTDNIIDSNLVPPEQVMRHDEDDPYLVVAADKGTATFSDLANSVSKEYQFWLGDAFASGGSNGYDHKAMGITAKGGWESVKRHFREMGINCQTTDFTCIGIGDMAGDVFGNGMLLSKHIKLVAAFNHMHIFIDPTPDPALSWKERERLFKLPRSSWEDYDSKLISSGGGLFSRKAKSITLTSQMQQMLGVNKQSMTPNELIKNLLQMPVDLLWNGGIGTYVKAESETHGEVGDRANDNLRVNGNELGAKIVGEGGNLGLTQKARIEYALSGGYVNTDFIDNVGGVDCSDNEVNIKILLNALVANGDLTEKKRNQILSKMEEDVANIVLKDAYEQSESISVTASRQSDQIKEQMRFIHHMEKEGKLDRQLENLPDDESLMERKLNGQGLTRPEIAVLLSYGKMSLKEQLLVDKITEDPYFAKLLPAYFPKELQRNYSEGMENHPLRKEIIATALANQMSNDMGFNFVIRMEEETGAEIADIAVAYVIAKEIFDFGSLYKDLRQMDNQIPAEIQYEVIYRCRRKMRRVSRWVLRNPIKNMSIEQQIAFYKPTLADVESNLEQYLVPIENSEYKELVQSYVEQLVPEKMARKLACLGVLYSALDLAQISVQLDQKFEIVARLYFLLGDTLSLHWFLQQINNQSVENHWQALARASFREELDWQQRGLTQRMLENAKGVESAEHILESWMEDNESKLLRWQNIVSEFKVGQNHEFAKFAVALRELTLLNLN